MSSSSSSGSQMTDRLHHGRLIATVAELVDAGIDLLPHFELAAIPVLENADRPAEWPAVRRRLRAEGIRTMQHRGVLLLEPGELDRFSAVGLFRGMDELFLCAEWNDEFEPFPGRIAGEGQSFEITTPLGLEEWMVDAGCLLALGDGEALNWATLELDLGDRLRMRFPALKA